MRNWLLVFALLATAGIAAGCHGSSSGASGPTPIPTSSIRSGADEVAYGDDFTVGIGTQFCGLSPSGPCATSQSVPGVSVFVNPTGWSQRFGGALQNNPRWAPSASVIQGVYGALSGDAPKPEGSGGDLLSNSGQFGNLKTLVTNIRSNNIRMIVVVQSGINDVFDAFYSALCVSNGGTVTGGGNATLAAPCTASGTTLEDSSNNVRNGTLYNAFRTMLANLDQLAGGPPEVTIVVGVPDVGSLPYSIVNFSAGQRATLTADSQLANTAMQDAIADQLATNGKVAFADWYGYFAANPQYYTTTYYASDLLHLNDQGYAALETLVFQTFTTGFPTF